MGSFALGLVTSLPLPLNPKPLIHIPSCLSLQLPSLTSFSDLHSPPVPERGVGTTHCITQPHQASPTAPRPPFFGETKHLSSTLHGNPSLGTYIFRENHTLPTSLQPIAWSGEAYTALGKPVVRSCIARELFLSSPSTFYPEALV